MYMPSVATLRTKSCSDDEDGVANRPEKIKLMLSSELSTGTPCNPHLQNLKIEWDLWYAQANDALNEVRCSIQLYAHLTMFKTTNIKGQKANTCARSALNYAEKKKQQARAKYMISQTALEVLAPLLDKIDWDSQLRPLHDCDLRYMSDMLDGQTEGTCDLSWIWKMPGIMENSREGLQDSKWVLYLVKQRDSLVGYNRPVNQMV